MDFGLQFAFWQSAGTTARVIRTTCVTPGAEETVGIPPAGSLPGIYWGFYEPYPTHTHNVSHELPSDPVWHAGRDRRWQAAADHGR